MNVLIVDDDRIAVHCLASMIDWEKYGVRKVFKAYGKDMAEEIMQKVSMDVLFCDIEMPKGNGYELLQWIQKKNYRIVTVFFTSYARFDYAAKALKMKVVDYLLKPVTRERLEEAVKNAVYQAKIEFQREQNEKYAFYWNSSKNFLIREFWRKVIREDIFEEEELQTLADKLGVKSKEGKFYYPVYIHYKAECEHSIQWEEKLLSFSLENIASEYLFHEMESGNILHLEKGKMVIIYEVDEETKEMLREKCYYLMRKWKHFLSFCKIQIYIYDKIEWNGISHRVNAFLKKQEGQDLFQEGIFITEEEELLENVDDVIDKVKGYLKRHKKDDINRRSLADYVYLNQDYLSRLFKEKTGYSITEYLLELRMQEAKKLLLKTTKTISEVASESGYSDSVYFAKLFRRKYGISPREYRKNCGWVK